MSTFANEIGRIESAENLDEVRKVARALKASADRPDGVLYSGKIGDEYAERHALEVAREKDLPIINDTPRAAFLTDPDVTRAIDTRVKELLIEQGLDPQTAAERATTFRFGDATLPATAELSVERSLWGEASRDFARSLSGDITVVATNARADRVMGRVEIPEIIESGRVTTLGGVPLNEVARLHAQGGASAVLDEVQAPMRALAASGSPPRAGIGGRALGRGAAGIGLALTAAEGNEAVQRAASLYDMGNPTGARSELIHFGSRNAGAWGGAALGAGLGAGGTSWSGPGAIIGGIVGGAVGLVGGEKVADYLDHRSIYRQQDAQGGTWAFDPERPARGWRRTETIDLVGVNGQAYEQRREVVASGALASQLDRQATTVSFELMLARPPVPQDPYTLPSAPGDAASMPPSSWRRDAATGQWQRPIYEWQPDASDMGRTVLREIAVAEPARAAQLEVASQAILRQNVHLAPAAMAARFELAYRDKGWEREAPLPDSAQQALRDDSRLVASDGAEYQRQPHGGWQRQALFGLTTAEANPRIAAELDATRTLLQEGLREHRGLMAERPLPTAPTFEATMAESAARAYGAQGLAPPEADVQAMGRAMVADVRARSIDGPFLLQLERDPTTKQYGPDSPMGLYTRDADGDMSLRFTLTWQQARELATEPKRELTPAANANPPAPTNPQTQPSPTVSAIEPGHLDHALLQHLRSGVRRLDQQAGKGWDDASERLTASAFVMAKKKGFTAQDDLELAFNAATERYAVGEILHLTREGRNASHDPAGNRIHMDTSEALATPAEERYRQAEELDLVSERERAFQMMQQSQSHQIPGRDVPVMRMQ